MLPLCCHADVRVIPLIVISLRFPDDVRSYVNDVMSLRCPCDAPACDSIVSSLRCPCDVMVIAISLIELSW